MTAEGSLSRPTLVRGTALLALVLALLVTAGLSAYAAGASHDETAPEASVQVATAGTPDEDSLGTVTMTGRGEVTAVPDQMTFRLAVVRTEDDVATALDGSSRTLGRVLDALARAGVERKDTTTTGLSVDPRYDYLSSGREVLTGYQVRQSVSVLVRDLRSGGKAVAAAVGAGGNSVRVSGIRLQVGDRDALLAEARKAAVQEATAKAGDYVAAAGESLGRVLTIKEGRTAGRVAQPLAQVAGSIASDKVLGALPPVRAGRSEVGIQVTVVWALG